MNSFQGPLNELPYILQRQLKGLFYIFQDLLKEFSFSFHGPLQTRAAALITSLFRQIAIWYLQSQNAIDLERHCFSSSRIC